MVPVMFAGVQQLQTVALLGFLVGALRHNSIAPALCALRILASAEEHGPGEVLWNLFEEVPQLTVALAPVTGPSCASGTTGRHVVIAVLSASSVRHAQVRHIQTLIVPFEKSSGERCSQAREVCGAGMFHLCALIRRVLQIQKPCGEDRMNSPVDPQALLLSANCAWTLAHPKGASVEGSFDFLAFLLSRFTMVGFRLALLKQMVAGIAGCFLQAQTLGVDAVYLRAGKSCLEGTRQ